MKGVVLVADAQRTMIYDRERGIKLIDTQKFGVFKRSDNAEHIVWE